jgi:hypothetical protein
MPDTLLAPLTDFKLPKLDDEELDTKIPIPSPEHLKKLTKTSDSPIDAKLMKYQKEYEKFCQWAALPKEQRKPKTAVEFERKNFLPKGYTNYFKQREDFMDKRLTYFWEWMMDLYPDVVHAVYKRAVDKGGSKDAQIFLEMITKRLNLDKPKLQVQPMILMGVPQDKIDALFTPKGYDSSIVPGKVMEPGGGDKRYGKKQGQETA